MSEWSKEHDWKSCRRKRLEGSNPSRSATFWFMLVPELQVVADDFASRLATGKIDIGVFSEREIKILPKAEDSFPITISVDQAGTYKIEMAGWSSHQTKPDVAAGLACWLLTPYYRVVSVFKSGEKIRTFGEYFTEEGWESFAVIDLNQDVDPDEIRIYTQAVFLDSSFKSYNLKALFDAAGYPQGTLLGEVEYRLVNGEWHPLVPEMPQD
jgi:hypothetical protein